MAIRLVIDRNDARHGHVIDLHDPPPGMADDMACAASTNREVVSVIVITEDGQTTKYCKGQILSSGFYASNVIDAPQF